jgi:hypothetical protein
MSVLRKLLACVSYMVIVMSCVSGFAAGAVFGETVINKSESPTCITYYLAGQFD